MDYLPSTPSYPLIGLAQPPQQMPQQNPSLFERMRLAAIAQQAANGGGIYNQVAQQQQQQPMQQNQLPPLQYPGMGGYQQGQQASQQFGQGLGKGISNMMGGNWGWLKYLGIGGGGPSSSNQWTGPDNSQIPPMLVDDGKGNMGARNG